MHVSWTLLCYLILIVFSCDVLDVDSLHSPAPTTGIGSLRFINVEASTTRLKGKSRKSYKEGENIWHGRELEIVDSGPGSKPPKCETKCAKCTPCTPVRVPVQPGPHKASEYYPEAWRCKCKGKLYMP